MAYLGSDVVFCPRAAARGGCARAARGVASIARLNLGADDHETRCRTALFACQGCADPEQCEVDEEGAVCMVPRPA